MIFKIGDRVIVNWLAGDEYKFSTPGSRGTVTRIKGGIVLVTFDYLASGYEINSPEWEIDPYHLDIISDKPLIGLDKEINDLFTMGYRS